MSFWGILDQEAPGLETIVDVLAARVADALEPRREVLEAYLFGSHVRGEGHPHSDVDIAVFIDKESARSGLFGYQSELTAILMSALRTNSVDVVILNDAPPLLYHRVLRDGRRLLSRDLQATTVREGRALSRYCDFSSHLAKIDETLRAVGTDKSTDHDPREFASQFRSVAGFRNILVHGYLEVDLELLHLMLSERLGDFETFAAHVEAYLQTI